MSPQAKTWGLMGIPFPAKPAVKSMPLCHWGSKPDGDGAQLMATRGGLKVLLHWAGPGGGEPWVTFNEATLTAEDVCMHIAHKVGESYGRGGGADRSWTPAIRLPIYSADIECVPNMCQSQISGFVALIF